MPRFPLTLIEEYFLAEDKPSYPCWIILRFRLRGALQREALQAAWRLVVRRHTMLHSIVQRDERGRSGWMPVPEENEPVFIWHHGADIATCHHWTPLDPTREPAVRLVVAQGVETCEISLEGHHALFDGAAVFMVVHEIFLHYARHLGVAVEIPQLRPELFARRNQFGLDWWKRLKLAPVQLLGLWFAWQMQSRPVMPLAPYQPAAPAGAPPAGFPNVLHQNLAAPDVARLRDVAKQNGSSLNDLLIRDLQAAIGVWRIREGIGEADDWIVIGVPVSLRRPADRLLPSANVIGIVAIDRRGRSLADRPRLLRRAREDMNLVKRHNLGYTFLVLLALWRRLRGGIARYSDKPGCRATVVLTNLGQPFSRSPLLDGSRRIALPGAVLEDYLMIAPCRPGTAASVAVALYAGRLHVDLHYDPRALNDRQAETFLAAFIEQLYTSIAERKSEG